jgi:hypothetical protein
MRRVLTLLAPLALVLALASPVSAAPPTKEPQEAFSTDFAAGEVCAFPVRQETTDIKAKTIIFNRHDGAFREITTGRIVERITNLDTGASVIRKSSGPGKLSINAAGHLEIKFGGSSVVAFFEGDVTGAGLLYMTGGGATFEIGDDGFFFVRVDLPAHVEDLCATLA